MVAVVDSSSFFKTVNKNYSIALQNIDGIQSAFGFDSTTPKSTRLTVDCIAANLISTIDTVPNAAKKH